MKLVAVFFKTTRQIVSDRLTLLLSLTLAPLMVLAYFAFFGGSGSTVYTVAVVNGDRSAPPRHGEKAIAVIDAVTYADGNALLKTVPVSDQGIGEMLLRDRKAAALLVIPPTFSESIAAMQRGDATVAASLTLIGDLSNPYYAVTATLAYEAISQYVQIASGAPVTLQLTEIALGGSGARSEFDIYVPGIMVFAAILQVFMTTLIIAREAESGTLRRLRLTQMRASDYIVGTSAAIAVVAVLAVIITCGVAVLCGFQSEGPIWAAILIGIATSVSVIGVGIITGCFCTSTTQAALAANVPLALFIFFSGSMFPLPRIELFQIAGRGFALFDLLPPTHAVIALNKIFTIGAGIADIAYELSMIAILSTVYFAVGIWLFHRTHLRRA